MVGRTVVLVCQIFTILIVLAALNLFAELENIFFEGGLSGVDKEYLIFGWPRTFWFFSGFEWPDFLFDVVVWLFILVGATYASNSWISKYGAARSSIGSVVAAVAAIALYLSTSRDGDNERRLFPYQLDDLWFGLCAVMSFAFGIATCGWCDLVMKAWKKARKLRIIPSDDATNQP